VAIVVLACSALLASIIPACRASMISPLDALRTE
jgi:ABC-type lipoprotein release transport system permease subunit